MIDHISYSEGLIVGALKKAEVAEIEVLEASAASSR
jgi:hypothetical protein